MNALAATAFKAALDDSGLERKDIDGIVALEGGRAPSGGIISGRNEADRFVMGLLRAFAEAVLVSAGTVRAEGGKALWTPDYIFPAAAKAFAALRRALKREKTPRLVIVSGSDALDPSEPALEVGALVLTTAASAKRLRAVLPKATEVRAISDIAALRLPAANRRMSPPRQRAKPKASSGLCRDCSE